MVVVVVVVVVVVAVVVVVVVVLSMCLPSDNVQRVSTANKITKKQH